MGGGGGGDRWVDRYLRLSEMEGSRCDRRCSWESYVKKVSSSRNE